MEANYVSKMALNMNHYGRLYTVSFSTTGNYHPSSPQNHMHLESYISNHITYSEYSSSYSFQRQEHALKFRPLTSHMGIFLSVMFSIRGTRRCFTLLLPALLFLLPISSYLLQLPSFLPIFLFFTPSSFLSSSAAWGFS